jgi:hypothetical protein
MFAGQAGQLAHQDIGARQGSYAAMASGRTFNVVIVSAGRGVGGDTTTAPDQTIHYAGATIEAKFYSGSPAGVDQGTIAKWLFHQEKATLNSVRNGS